MVSSRFGLVQTLFGDQDLGIMLTVMSGFGMASTGASTEFPPDAGAGFESQG